MPDAFVVLVSAPESEAASRIARTVVDEHLAACVNVLPAVRSIYRWQGAVYDESEVLLLIKTTAARFAALRERVLALHPYDTPEVLALPVVDGSEKYLAWVASETEG